MTGTAKFVRHTRCYRILIIKADNQTRNSAAGLPDDLAPSSRSTLTYALI